MNITIRNATIEDVDNGLLDVFIEGYKVHQKARPDIFLCTDNDILRQNLINSMENSTVLVVLNDESIVGYLSYIIKGNKSKKMNVDELVILEKYRGKGLGKRMINEAKKKAKENNCDRIELNCWLFNENALAMYEHIGFKKQRIMYEMKIK